MKFAANLIRLACISLIIQGCSSLTGRNELLVNEMIPDESEVGAQLDVAILGQGFHPDVSRNVSCSGEDILVNDSFTASLSMEGAAPLELLEVVYDGATSLHAVVPGTFPPGTYTLSLKDPSGRVATLTEAFRVVGADDPDGGPDTDTDSDSDTDNDGGIDTDTGECSEDVDCDDGNDCTDDTCGGGECTHVANTAPCDDGLFCTSVDTCVDEDCHGDLDSCPGQICDEGTDSCLDFIEVPDPLGDSSAFAFVFFHNDRIWVGPRTDGTGAVSMLPDGTDPQSVSFSFARDDIGNDHRNNAVPPYPSIGQVGCAADSYGCGPDNEDGRGLFTSGTMGGDEWLMIAGARSGGDLDYVYLSTDDDAVIDFNYFDLSEVLGAGTEGVSTAHVFADRLYVGFPDRSGSRPYMVVLFYPPGVPGLDALGNGAGDGGDCDPAVHDACNLGGANFPGIGGSANPSSVDSIWDFNDRLYVANNGGVVRSTTEYPLNYNQSPDDWFEVTPGDLSYAAFTSYETTKTANLEPADKAVPGIVDFGGRLFFARNTTIGPQLWSCAPDHDSSPITPATLVDCDPQDWQLVAPDGAGLLALTRFGNIHNGSISLLAASQSYLYVGFDNGPDGVVVFRTADPAALLASDYLGLGDCSAADHPATCDGLGGSGLGGLSNLRIFSHALLTQDDKDYLYLIVGDGIDAAALYVLGS